MKYVLLFVLTALLPACVNLSKQQCETMNWFDRGKQDGSDGEEPNKFAQYNKSCQRHGVAVDFDRYVAGHKEGIKLFCTYDSGMQTGLRGRSDPEVCDPSGEFSKGYRAGKKEHDLKVREEKVERKEKELEEEEAKLRARKRALSDSNTTTCKWSSDCRRPDKCLAKRCKKSGDSCNWDSDCTEQGRCSSESVCESGHCDSIEICKY